MSLNKSNILYVPLYLIILIVAIPQLSETIYVPSLPDLARDFNITANLSEYTLSIYLCGFAVGVLIWGSVSDFYGRKPCLIAGLVIYLCSCFLCYKSDNINMLLFARFIQAFGASVGSVLGQAIARDAIKPEERGKLFSSVSMAMAFAPAIGPLIGGGIIEFYHWSYVFIALMIIAIFTILMVIFKLVETNQNIGIKREIIPLYRSCFMQMIKDKRILGFAFLIGAVNGILFGYFAEAPFYFITSLNFPSSLFGMISFSICIPLALGGFISRKLINKIKADNLVLMGIILMVIGSLCFFTSSLFGMINENNITASVIQTLIWVGVVVTGISIVIPNVLSQALENYGNFAGTAASLFGFIYYLIVACFTLLMANMHNGSLIILPLFMLIVSIMMVVVFYTQIRNI